MPPRESAETLHVQLSFLRRHLPSHLRTTCLIRIWQLCTQHVSSIIGLQHKTSEAKPGASSWGLPKDRGARIATGMQVLHRLQECTCFTNLLSPTMKTNFMMDVAICIRNT